MKIIGITGLTGSGKSEAARVFGKKGGYVIDADKAGHRVLLKGGAAYGEVVEEFGAGILDVNGGILRHELGKIVFSNLEKLERLNEITHKYIVRDILDETERVKESGGYRAVVMDVVLLYESGLSGKCDEVVAVVADEEMRLERITARDGIGYETAVRRVRSQNMEAYREFVKDAGYVLVNDGSFDEFIKKAEKLADLIMGGADEDS